MLPPTDVTPVFVVVMLLVNLAMYKSILNIITYEKCLFQDIVIGNVHSVD